MTHDDPVIDVILKETERVENFLNNDLLQRFGDVHNIPKEFNMFKLKQEVIAKTALFPNVKKKYALYLVYNEGMLVDKLDLKGLVTQRSDYPEITRKTITKLLELVLKEETLNIAKVRNFVEGVRERMLKKIQQHVISTGRPVSYTKDEGDYKVIPYQVSGMLLWNELEYNYFTKGTKGSCFKLKGLNTQEAPEKVQKAWANLPSNLSKDYIVVPNEESKLPMYYDIDEDYTIGFLWDKRVSEILGSILDGNVSKAQEDRPIEL